MSEGVATHPLNEFSGRPLLIAVAPNGARLSHQDHPKLPMTPQEMAECALTCHQAGAGMLHMHARDKNGRHTLDPAVNQTYLDKIRETLGAGLIVQLSTECADRFSPQDQMALLRRCQPEAASIALRELVPDQASEPAAQALFGELADYPTICQLIIYSREDLLQYYRLLAQEFFSNVATPSAFCCRTSASRQ